MALLGALLVTGLVLAGLGTAFGAGAVFQEKTPLWLEAVSEGNFTKIAVFRDGAEIGTYNTSGARAISIVSSTSSGEIRIGGVPRLAMVGTYYTTEQYTKLSEEQRCKVVEIAKENSTVQEILGNADEYKIRVQNVFRIEIVETEGKEEITATVPVNAIVIKSILEEDKAKVEIDTYRDVENTTVFKPYIVTVDLADEKVTDISEGPEIRKGEPAIMFSIANITAKSITMMSGFELLEIAKKDEGVQELIEGKDYQVVGVLVEGKNNTNTATLTLEIEGKYYGITIDLDGRTVKSIEETQKPGHALTPVNIEGVYITNANVAWTSCEEENLTEEEKARAKEIAFKRFESARENRRKGIRN